MELRIGHGYDVHRLAEREADDIGSTIALGGVPVSCERRLLAHSDGDVLIHALCDAMLGALGQGDIGHHFPDHDEAYKGIDSSQLLSRVKSLSEESGFDVVNADLTVIAQTPRLAPHISAMRARLASLLDIDISCLNVKATTNEGLGHIGRAEGIACHAVILLQRTQDR